MKNSNLRHSLTGSQNKGLSEYQRRVSLLWIGLSPLLDTERQAGDIQSRKVRGDLGPRDSILHQTVSRLPATNEVFLGSWMVDICQEGRSQRSAPRGDTRHIWDGALAVHQGNQGAGTGEVIRCTAQMGECTRQAPGCLSCSDLWMAQNADPTESVPLWSPQEPEPERVDLGSARNPGPALDSSPAEQPEAWAVQTGKAHTPWVDANPEAHTRGALPTHTSDICLQCSSFPTAQLNKWA